MPTGVYKRKPFTEERLKNMKLAAKKRVSSSLFKVGHSINKNRTSSLLHRQKISLIQKEKARKGLHHFWKGGITEINKALRTGLDYRLWRTEVFKRDNWTCQVCNSRGLYVEAHHIKRFSDYPELRFETSNGVTLCRSCHNETKKKEEWWEKEFSYLKRLDEVLEAIIYSPI